MTEKKESLSLWIDGDRGTLVDFLSRFIQAKSPNPPGDTRAAAAHVRQFLDAKGLPYRVIAPQEDMPNIVGSFECGAQGRHLILNGHIDVFPAGDPEGWSYDPWSGAVADGRIYGRGVTDMKCGMASLIFTFAYLHRIRNQLKGRLTLTCVSDEETFGPWGSRYLVKHHPEVHGDCFLGADGPSGIVFGDKGLIWLIFTVQTPGSHGAYTHVSPSATKIAARLISDLEALSEIQAPAPKNVERVLRRGAEFMDESQGKGAAEIAQKVTVNIGTVRGGLTVNMVPGRCVVEADIRLPIGLDKERIMLEVEKIVARYPEVSYEEINYSSPNWSNPEGEMVKLLQANIKALKGFEPEPTISLGGTDARLWRSLNVPAYLCAPVRHNMAAADEYVEVEEYIHIAKTHALSAYDYLTQS